MLRTTIAYAAVLTFMSTILPVAAGQTGTASHYSAHDHDQNGTRTACGPPLRDSGLTAAHRSLPCGTRVRVTNHRSGRSVVVVITDRGPFAKGRIIDLSMGAARAIGVSGLASVSLDRI